MVDGLKPGQRKVLFGAFLKKLTNEVKVAQLSGFVAEKSAYHHGETSLQGTIIGMAFSPVPSRKFMRLRGFL
ncbi:top2mt [Symbiodinium necroappetens]|uniref:DNA topoisomerase (ATP-hydrolyzing) n=1 Tax=Symbiodinium necroappetens TaxID=1628268 RepID=A0A812M9L2_9DINO|nr:top2mt [Symbiodinium necroappetens]